MADTEVDRRLREASRLSGLLGARARRPVDMSSEAVDRRLREVAEVSRVCLALEAAGRAHRAAASGLGSSATSTVHSS